MTSLFEKEKIFRNENLNTPIWDGYLNRIKRPDIKERINPPRPWAFFSAEVYNPSEGLHGAGGLGILAADIAKIAGRLQAPLLTVTPFYSNYWQQIVNKQFRPAESWFSLHPLSFGFNFTNQRINLTVRGLVSDKVTPIEIWRKDNILVPYCLDLHEVYSGKPDSDQRLFQQMVGGWAGMQAVLGQGMDPGVIQLNEGSSVFAALAYLDYLIEAGLDLNTALTETQAKTILTNHTLVPAAWNKFNEKQLDNYLYPNIESETVRQWIKQKLVNSKDHKLDLGMLALDLAGNQNGVSVKHADIASHSRFVRSDGSTVQYVPVTNGIDTKHWTHRLFQSLYKEIKVYDEYGLPVSGVKLSQAIEKLREKNHRQIKQSIKADFLKYLRDRSNQYGQSILIPEEANIAVWARRFADYKRPGMIFSQPDRLAGILESFNTYFIMAGRAHPDDGDMKDEMQYILKSINAHDILKNRVIFVENYDPVLAEHLNAGADVAINTPIVGNEACGTSIFKLISNDVLVVSTRDGGLADAPPGSFFEISGKTQEEETESLYEQFVNAIQLLQPGQENAWRDRVVDQFNGLARYISGERMIADYLNFIFPQSKQALPS